MSILVEIAQQADVSVEGVVRVLTREPVSEDVLERVLGVLDDLEPEQTRAVQRFALAALHDVLPRPLDPSTDAEAESEREAGAGDDAPAPLPALTTAAQSRPERPPPARAAPDAALVELSGVLSELAEAVRDLRRETDIERRERVDDLAVLIDLITTGWQGLDARLGRIERQLNRIDAGRKTSTAPPPARPTPALAAPVPAETEVAPAGEPTRRSRLPLTAALTLAGVLIGTFAVLQFLSGGPDVADLVSARGAVLRDRRDATAGTGAQRHDRRHDVRPPRRRRRPGRPGRRRRRTRVHRRPGSPRRRRRPSSARPSARRSRVRSHRRRSRRRRRHQPRTTTSGRHRRLQAHAQLGLGAGSDADYYSVEFTRGGQIFYRATPTEPRLTLPGSVVFRPGSYRWIVRAGFGAPAAKRLGNPVVNSGFTVS